VLDNRIVWKLTVENIDRAVSEIFRTTDNHPWWVPGSGWIETKDLTVGMNVITKDGETLTVADVTETEDRATVYNLTVDGLHTYFVGKQRVLVHNCPIGDIPGADVTKGNSVKNTQFNGSNADLEKSVTDRGLKTSNPAPGITNHGDVKGAGESFTVRQPTATKPMTVERIQDGKRVEKIRGK